MNQQWAEFIPSNVNSSQNGLDYTSWLLLFFNRHQIADAVLKITFLVSKIVGNVTYQINLAKYRISPNVAGRRQTFLRARSMRALIHLAFLFFFLSAPLLKFIVWQISEHVYEMN